MNKRMKIFLKMIGEDFFLTVVIVASGMLVVWTFSDIYRSLSFIIINSILATINDWQEAGRRAGE